jgi:hypothetical protein
VDDNQLRKAVTDALDHPQAKVQLAAIDVLERMGQPQLVRPKQKCNGFQRPQIPLK